MPDLDTARSFLFVPGDRPERFAKAAASGAHAVIIDLEDAVAPDAKASARRHIIAYLDEHDSRSVLVRINDAESSYFEDDLLLSSHPKIAGVILPKANERHTIELAHRLNQPVWPLLETVQGVSEARSLALAPNIGRLLLGTIDLSLEMGLQMDHPGGQAMLDQARFALVSASCLAGIAAPVDGVFADLDDMHGLAAAAQYARATGMGGMMCIHPRQIEHVHEGFAPHAVDLEWAEAVIEASLHEKSSFRFRGQMVDKPVLDRARRILSQTKPG